MKYLIVLMNVCIAFLLFTNCTSKNSKAAAEKENQGRQYN